jgi:hypothetical protein
MLVSETIPRLSAQNIVKTILTPGPLRPLYSAQPTDSLREDVERYIAQLFPHVTVRE